MNKYKLTCLLLTLFLSLFSFAQNEKNPVLYPYELGARGGITLPENFPEGIFKMTSDKMELRDLPKDYPYRTVAYFDDGKLITLHVLFGETGIGFSLEDYESIREILIKHWKDYPTGTISGRRGLDTLTQVWETSDFRIEWIYKNKADSKTEKMGWLYFYSRDKHIESY